MNFRERIKGYVRRALGYLRNERGQTSLTEAAAAIAVGLTLAASLGPVVISVGDSAKVTRAKNDVVAIGKAIQFFFSDTKVFPVRSAAPTATGGGQVDAPITLSEVAVRFLRSGNDTAADEKRNPSLISTHSLGSSIPDATCAHLLNNHLVFDDTAATCSSGGAAAKASLKYRAGLSGGTQPVNWKGPYIPEVFQDPWGRNYIVLPKGGLVAANKTLFTQTTSLLTGVGACPVVVGGTTTQCGLNTSQFYAWVVSAGPDGILQTDESDTVAQGDDIGTIFAVINVNESTTSRSQ